MTQKIPVNASHNRAANLRQRLLRASRVINIAIVDGLQQRGFTELRSTHTALLSNLDLDGCSLSVVAQRAGMTKQAMGRLADELIELKYIERTRSDIDRRAVKLVFTPAGLTLMHQSFAIMENLQKRCASRLGEKQFTTLLASLQAIVEEFENPPK